MEKVALKKTVWIAFPLLQMYQAFLSLGYCIFVESGTTSEVSIIGKNHILPVLLLCPNGCRIIICCATFISAIATDILTFHFNKYSQVITATNQCYLVLYLVIMGSSIIFRVFRKYSPNWLTGGLYYL